ncbi:MAG: hypothetical protein LBQ08_04635 [Holosporaceae bacterium]|nr:hypothetical protein [Holosporaceae bacterium]
MKKMLCMAATVVCVDALMAMDISRMDSVLGIDEFVHEISALVPVNFRQASEKTMATIEAVKSSSLDDSSKVTILDAIDRKLGPHIPTARIEAQNKIKEITGSDYSLKGYGEYLWKWIQTKPERCNVDFVRTAISKLYGPNTEFLQSIASNIVKLGMRLYLPSRLSYKMIQEKE